MQKILNDLVNKSQFPVDDPWLEGLQETYEKHNYYRFLYYLVKDFKPPVCLEIGSYCGVGAAYMAIAAHEYGGKVMAIDIKPHEMLVSVIPKKCDNFTFIHGSSIDIKSVIRVYENSPLGLVFQDSSHHYIDSVIEWRLYSQLLNSRAIWVCDDITPAFYAPKTDPPGLGMVEYFESRPGDKVLIPNRLHQGNTMGVVYNI